jgi:hypothetical protein
MKWSGKSCATRKHSSLQIAAQVLETSKSPMWCAMKLARGLKIVRSLPRCFIRRSWLALDGLAQFVVADLQVGHLGHGGRVLDAGDLRLRQVSSALGAVV